MAVPRSAGDRASDGDHRAGRARVTAEFLMAVAEEVGGDVLAPEALARASARVLRVDGAGLSMMVSLIRQPLGATSDDCRLAEELQTTVGDGPCLEAAKTQTNLVADLDELRERWAPYTEELTRQTPFRSVASVPLRAPGRGVFAALDLYSTSSRLSGELDRDEADDVGEMTGALLATCLEQIEDVDSPDAGPGWYRDASSRRHDVWVAIGMVMSSRDERARDALSLLRAHAYGRSRSLDDLAADLVRGQVPLSDLDG
jgi:hypothetical protein